jgi:hypothetical protein
MSERQGKNCRTEGTEVTEKSESALTALHSGQAFVALRLSPD